MHGLPVYSFGFVRGHDAEVGEQEVAHVLVYDDGATLVALCDQAPHQVLIQQFVVRLYLHSSAAERDQLRSAGLRFQHGKYIQNGLEIDIVEIGGKGDNPRFRGQLGQEVTLIQFQSL